MCILMNSASPSSVCDDDCAELSANLCEQEQTDIVQSHIRETTHEKCKREVQTCNEKNLPSRAVHGVSVNGAVAENLGAYHQDWKFMY